MKKLIKVVKDGKFGLLDEDLKMILEPKYTGIFNNESYGDYLTICYGSYYGLMDSNLNVIIEPIYKDIEFIYIDYNFIVVKTIEDKRKLFDITTKQFKDVEYDYFDLDNINKGYILAYKDSKTTLLDRSFNVIKDVFYTTIDLGYIDRGLIIYTNDEDKEGLMDLSLNKLTEPVYDFIKFDENVDYLEVSKDRKISLMDFKGNLLLGELNFKYDYVGIRRRLSNVFYKIELNGKFGLLDSNFKVLVEPVYDDLLVLDYNINATLNKECYVIDFTGKIVNRVKDCYIFNDKYIFIKGLDGKCGLLDHDLKVALEPIYDKLTESNSASKYILFSLNDMKGIMDGDLNVLVEPQYDNIEFENDTI